MKLKPDTILQRTNEIELKLDSIHRIEIIVNEKRHRTSNHTLMILTVFAHPISLKDALNELQTKGLQDWIKLTETINMLWQIGALSTGIENKFMADKSPASFGAAPIHIAMLNDKVRTEYFIQAINKIVKKGDVVVDIGTGTGVLAITAARAGAKMVYAIEAGAMADVAQTIINNTEVADKIKVIRGWSTQIELPEKADVLVSEIIGNDPYGEKVLQTFKDAHQRLLKPNALVLPGKMKVLGLPVSIPGAMLQNRILRDEEFENWKNWYGIDFSPLKNMDAPFQSEAILMVTTKQAKELEIMGEPLLLAKTNFHTFQEVKINNVATAISRGPFNALLIYFELDLVDNILSNHPVVAFNSNSWRNPVWYFPEAENLKTSDEFSVKFTYGEGLGSEVQILAESRTI